MKKLLLSIIVVVLLVFIYMYNSGKKVPVLIKSPDNKISSEKAKDEKILYTNMELWFKIYLPKELSDYTTKAVKITSDTTRILFYLPTHKASHNESFPLENLKGYEWFFVIDAMDLESWNKFLADCNSGKESMGCISEEDLLGKNRKFVFTDGFMWWTEDIEERIKNITFDYIKANFSAF